MKKAGLALQAIHENQSGAVAIVFGAMMLPFRLFIGAAIDYSRVANSRSRLQQAVDEAALIATTNQPAANLFFQSNLLGSGVSGASVRWTTNSDGSVTGDATGQVATSFLQIARVNQMQLSATATASRASQAPSDLVFTLTGGYGWFWKQVSLYIHRPGDSSDTLLASYTYQPVDLSYGGGRGYGTVTALFLNGGSMVSGAVTTPISMGLTYDKAYLAMTVYSDGCAPGYAPTTAQNANTTNFNCVVSGTTVTSWWKTTTYTKTATPVIYSTADPTTSQNLFVNGADSAPNTKLTVFSLLPCGQTVNHAWEDSPYDGSLPAPPYSTSNPPTQGSWLTQDIFFTIQTNCGTNKNYAGASKIVR